MPDEVPFLIVSLCLSCEMQMWTSKFHPVTERCLELHFVVDPVGNQLM
uniref:Uncharacterized protein n=2 Tax=Aegilops tauschii TaxID=37682 RepID=A0A453JYX4_AEGTS